MHIDHIPTSHFFKPALLPGSLSTIFGTAHSKVLLAFGSEERLSQLTWGQNDRAITVAEALAIREELERVRQTGIAYDIEECTPGVCAVAVPVWDGTGKVIASIAVVAPPETFHNAEREKISTLTRETGEALSRAAPDHRAPERPAG